jgi:hypothetical protein
MGKKVAYKSLITNLNPEMAGFEWLPDLEGIKTPLNPTVLLIQFV